MPVIDNKKQQSRKINMQLDQLDSIMDNLFTTTYHTTNRNDILFDKVSGDLNDTIKQVIEGDPNYRDLANTTKLYQKIVKKGGSNVAGNLLGYDTNHDPTDSNIMDMFNDGAMLGNLMETYADTKWIEALDDDIDMCLKYMPKLQTALNIKRDNVLCADSFSKTYLKFKQTDVVGEDMQTKFSENVKHMIDQYDLNTKSEEWYDLASKYGETFVYVVPYNKALEELLSRKGSTQSNMIGYQLREVSLVENGKLSNGRESGAINYKVNSSVEKELESAGIGSVKLHLDDSGVLSEIVSNIHNISKRINSNEMFRSVYESFLEESVAMNEAKDSSFEDHIKKSDKDHTEIHFNRTIDDVLEYDDEDKTASDGLVSQKSERKPRLKVPGCIVRTLERAKVIPLYIEDICLGYYYIHINPANLVDVNMNATTNGYNSITSMFNTNTTTDKEVNGDVMLKYIAGEISKSIDANFINTNTDLKKEIYMMLKYNDRFNRVTNAIDMNVTFIPAEDIVHYHFNFDKKTHRGRSDLWDSLIPAKMWIMVNTTTVLGQVTRSQDRRVYYVKNVVDTNVSKTLINVVNQIKKGNFGLRQMESINNILGVLGKFNDFVIPVGPSGDSPITFDIMSGQQFELPTELMQNLEESAVSQTGVPLEIVNSSNQMDFAIRYTMTNAMLLRNVLKRQVTVEKYLTKICNKIYNCEFDERASFTVELPPPAFLTLTQGSQLIQNAVSYIDTLADIEMAGASDEDRNAFRRKKLHHYLSNYIDVDLIEKIKNEIKMEKNIKKSEKQDDEM